MPKKPWTGPVHWSVRAEQRQKGGMDVHCGCGRVVDWERGNSSSLESDVTCQKCRAYLVMQGKGHRLRGGGF